MGYEKINVELIVFSEERDAVVAALNSAIDVIEESHTVFGGAIEADSVEHTGTRRKSAVRHTFDAGNIAIAAVNSAAQKVAGVYKRVI